MKSIKFSIWRFLGWLFVAAVLGFVMLLGGCVEKMFYFPDDKIYGLPTDVGLGFEDIVFYSADGTQLNGWFVPTQSQDALGTIVHFHGNAQNMTSHFSFVDWLALEGFNVFVFDYRGYGQSQGRSKKQGIYQDSIAALEYVFSRDDVDENKVMILGQSLGGNFAIAATAEFPQIRALVIDSTFADYRSIVADQIEQMPILGWFKGFLARLAINNKYSASENIGKIKVPVVFVHCKDDNIIGYHHSQRLYDMANEPRHLWLLEQGGHTWAFMDRQWRNKLAQFYLDCLD